MSDSWYVVQTRPRQESVAEINLLNQGDNAVVPRVCRRKRSSGKALLVHEPMFPGYLIVSLDVSLQDATPIRSTRGAIGLVRFGGLPRPLQPQVAEAVLKIHEIRFDRQSDNCFQKGDVVEVLDGPMAGFTATIDSLTSAERVILLLDMLGKETSTTVALDNIAKTG